MADRVEAEQVPPSRERAVPVFYFATVPVAIIAAGGLLLAQGGAVLHSNWAPQTLALTHIGTLGIVSLTCLGVAFPLAAQLFGERAPSERLARWIHALLVAGLTGLVAGLLGDARRVTFTSLALLALAMLAFLIPMGHAAWRADGGGPLRSGLRLSLASLFGVAFLGLWMAHGYVGVPFPGARELWVQVHLGIGILGWVGGLFAVASWWALPASIGAGGFAVSRQRAMLRFGAVGVALPFALVIADYFGVLPDVPTGWTRLATLLAAPAAYAFWFVQPVLLLESLRAPGRRSDAANAACWRAACIAAFATAATAIAVEWWPDPRGNLLFGWLAIWGWAGFSARAVLLELLPVLLRPGPLAPGPARGDVTSRRFGLWLHFASLAAGAVAIVSQSDAAARATGLLVVAAGVEVALRLRSTLRAAADEVRAAG